MTKNKIEMISKDEWVGSKKKKITLQGLQGKTVIVENKTVKIVKRNWLFAAKREKTLPIRNISSVEVKKPGFLISGFIQFSISGGQSLDSSYRYTGGAYDAAKDENSVLFTGEENYKKALRIKRYIENYSETNQTVASTYSEADEIIKYKKLLDDGIISQEEFEAKKKQLLGL